MTAIAVTAAGIAKAAASGGEPSSPAVSGMQRVAPRSNVLVLAGHGAQSPGLAPYQP